MYEEDKKRGECKMGVVESLVKGRDDVVSGANIKVLSRGKTTCISSVVVPS